MKQRLSILVVIFALILALIPTVGAQEDCFGLSADDCSAIETATANTLAASSFYQEFSVAISVAGLDAMGMPGGVNIEVQGSGPVMFTADDSPAQLQQEITYDATIGPDAQSGTIVASIVDGIFYFDDGNRVQGIDLAAQMEEADAMDAMAAFDPTAASLADMLGITADDVSLSTAGMMLPPSMTSFFTYERMGDEFVFTADITGLLNSPEFAALAPLISGLAGDQLGMEPEELEMMLPMFIQMIQSQLVVTQSIDPSGPVANGLGLNFDLTLDLSAFDPSAEAIEVSVVLDVTLSQFGESFDIAAPEGAEMVDPEEFDPGIELPF